ncbi:MAG: hypothetical protein ACREFI_03415, partial [Stellaceae bacterium]
MRFLWMIAALISLAIAAGAPARAEEKVVELQTRPGVTEAFLVTPVQGTPAASVILLTGSPGLLFMRDGAGRVRRNADGTPALYGGNFLIRT